jgi:hypothetical protein
MGRLTAALRRGAHPALSASEPSAALVAEVIAFRGGDHEDEVTVLRDRVPAQSFMIQPSRIFRMRRP